MTARRPLWATALEGRGDDREAPALATALEGRGDDREAPHATPPSRACSPAFVESGAPLSNRFVSPSPG
jgi:hypothetical protein